MTAPPVDARAAARRTRLGAALAATLAATAWVAWQPDDDIRAGAAKASNAAPASRTGRNAERTASATTAGQPAAWPPAPNAETRAPWIAVSASGIAAWGPPPPPPAAAAAPRKPTAAAGPPQPPAFPYTLIGRLDDGEPQALLSGPNRSFSVKAADVIDGQWRVDEVLQRGVTLTWLPGGTKRTLVLESS